MKPKPEHNSIVTLGNSIQFIFLEALKTSCLIDFNGLKERIIFSD